jgi:response regulator RpfG family c-di-GMP phosphodiesterase
VGASAVVVLPLREHGNHCAKVEKSVYDRDMNGKQPILFVDDDLEWLAGVRRRFRKKYRVDVASSAVRALEAVTEQGPYAVVVTDLLMPGLDGVSFLGRLKQTCPETSRIMLTGHADLRAAMAAVNTGQVFRFLLKPCPEEELEEALVAAVAAHLQAAAEKAFLKGALRGIIKVLTDLLGLLNAEAQQRAWRVKRLVLDMARFLETPEPWRLELAVGLSQVGAMVMPESMFATLRATGELTGDQARLFERHPAIAAELLGNIPRLSEISDSIRLQHARFDGQGSAPDDPSGQDLPLGARLLKLALDYDRLLTSGHDREQALAVLAGRRGHYDPRLLEVLASLAGAFEGYARCARTVGTLAPGMVLEEHLAGPDATVLSVVGQVVDDGLLVRLGEAGLDAARSVRVRVPLVEEQPQPGLDSDLLALLRKVRSCPPGK